MDSNTYLKRVKFFRYKLIINKVRITNNDNKKKRKKHSLKSVNYRRDQTLTKCPSLIALKKCLSEE